MENSLTLREELLESIEARQKIYLWLSRQQQGGTSEWLIVDIIREHLSHLEERIRYLYRAVHGLSSLSDSAPA
jgi:hypothetical protein